MATLWTAAPDADVLTHKDIGIDFLIGWQEHFPQDKSCVLLPIYHGKIDIIAFVIGQRVSEGTTPNKWCPVFTGIVELVLGSTQANVDAATITTLLDHCAQEPTLFDTTQKAWIYDIDCTQKPQMVDLDTTHPVKEQLAKLLHTPASADGFTAIVSVGKISMSVLIAGRTKGAEHEKNGWIKGMYGPVVVTGGHGKQGNFLFTKVPETQIPIVMAWCQTQPSMV
jgi:hypothetical protein